MFLLFRSCFCKTHLCASYLVKYYFFSGFVCIWICKISTGALLWKEWLKSFSEKREGKELTYVPPKPRWKPSCTFPETVGQCCSPFGDVRGHSSLGWAVSPQVSEPGRNTSCWALCDLSQLLVSNMLNLALLPLPHNVCWLMWFQVRSVIRRWQSGSRLDTSRCHCWWREPVMRLSSHLETSWKCGAGFPSHQAQHHFHIW